MAKRRATKPNLTKGKKTDKNITSTNRKPNTIITFSPKQIVVALTTITLITFIVYFPTLDNELTNWDDDRYVTKNPYIQDASNNNLGKMFRFDSYYMGNYHPLSMLSLKIDSLFSVNNSVRVYHISNLLLHCANSLLVFWFTLLLLGLIYKTRQQIHLHVAFIVALLFGVHTLHVESVAWISERKDVLYTLFFFASLIAYTSYLTDKKAWKFVLSLFLFFLSLLSKGQAVSLSITLIAIDLLADRRFNNVRVWIEKAPFLALSLLFGLLAVEAQKHGEAIHDISEFAFHERIMYAAYAFDQYIFKLIFPYQLSPIYPYPYKRGEVPAYFFFYLIPAVALLYGFLIALQKNKPLAFGIAFFVINIALLLQFIPVGSAVMADRYVYVASFGFFIVIGIGYAYLNQTKKVSQTILLGFLSIYILILSIRTYQQSDVWQTSLTLWNTVLEKQPKAVVAWNNRGSIMSGKGTELEELGNLTEAKQYFELAVKDFSMAIDLKPDYAHAFYNRGTAKKDLQQYESALIDFDAALYIEPDFLEATYNKGITYDKQADSQGGNIDLYQKAIEYYNRAVEIDSFYVDSYVNRGVVKGKLGNYDEAIADFNKVITLDTKNKSAYSNRGYAKALKKDFDAAITDYNRAIELDTLFVDAYFNRALAWRGKKEIQKAIDDLSRAINLRPNFAEAFFWRGISKMDINLVEQACSDWNTATNLGNPKAKQLFMQYCNRPSK